MKGLVSDKRSHVDNYRQKLEKLRDDFLREVLVTVEINVFRVLAEVSEVNKNIKVLSMHHILHHLGVGVTPRIYRP
jgi:hypothetical protein